MTVRRITTHEARTSLSALLLRRAREIPPELSVPADSAVVPLLVTQPPPAEGVER